MGLLRRGPLPIQKSMLRRRSRSGHTLQARPMRWDDCRNRGLARHRVHGTGACCRWSAPIGAFHAVVGGGGVPLW